MSDPNPTEPNLTKPEQTTADNPDINGAMNPDITYQPEASILPEQPLDPSFMVTLPLMQPNSMEIPINPPISADEIALYDRQIRLWGVKAQELIRSANILLIGIKALGNEVAKNLVLAGIGSLTIVDHEIVTDDDLGGQFLVSEDDIGKSRAEVAADRLRAMNPRVTIFTDTDLLINKLPEYFSVYDITIATNLAFDLCTNVNLSCRMFNRRFYAADCHGMYGYIFSDLIMHDFVVEREQPNIATKPMTAENLTRSVINVTTKRENDKVIETVTKREMYSMLMLANSSPLAPEMTRLSRNKMRITPLLTCLRALFDFQRESGGRLPAHNRADLEIFTRLANERHLELQLPKETLRSDFLRSFIQNLGSELSPVVAFLGGNLAQDIINVLGQREAPLQNMLLFDGEVLKAPIYSLHPMNDPNINAQMNGNGLMDETVAIDTSSNGLAI